MRLFLDANVLFSAAASPAGVASGILRLTTMGACELVTSSSAITEAERNLRAKAPGAIEAWRSAIAAITVVPEADPRLSRRSGAELPGKDLPIVAAAIACHADVLVTGDRRHFGPLFRRVVGGALLLPPRYALAWLLSHLEAES